MQGGWDIVEGRISAIGQLGLVARNRSRDSKASVSGEGVPEALPFYRPLKFYGWL